jgi:tRNA (cytidine/uridine-2'-O-)-methyltransferase
MLLFGPETRGLLIELARAAEESARLTIPMLPANRSLNLSNAVAVVVYEGWRHLNYVGTESAQNR